MKYTNLIKNHTATINYANRGMELENDLNLTNTYYLDNDIAVIYKKPTPIKIVRVDFDYKKSATIREAYFKMPSTTDYNGLYKGKYIDFEAKEIKGRKSFPLANINNHQIKHIRNILKHGGIAFIIVKFSLLNKIFLLKGEDLITIIDTSKLKSIPLSTFESKGYLIKEAYMPRLDYIKIIDRIYLGG
ncbi:MAG: Holliday junction resolvase RecU [Bacilli bacterium]|nr:Holliday junction resolvase RecU [Bacilli bacterium]MDD4298217.1 Holliday junction resolvase RecU [Bacilli bacterium]MDD4643470.1 Holliday junction resolvase RecU [Bacilli bacterium]